MIRKSEQFTIAKTILVIVAMHISLIVPFDRRMIQWANARF